MRTRHKKLAVLSAAGTFATIALRQGRPLAAATAAVVACGACSALTLRRAIGKTMNRMGADGLKLNQRSLIEHVRFLRGFLTWRLVKRLVWLLRERAVATEFKVGTKAPEVQVWPLLAATSPSSGMVSLLRDVARSGRPLVLNFGSCT